MVIIFKINHLIRLESFPDAKQPLAKLSLQDSLAESDFSKQRKIVQKLIEENRYPVTANISKETDLLVKFSVNKSVFTLGDVIKGTFDFSQGTIPCYQVKPYREKNSYFL